MYTGCNIFMMTNKTQLVLICCVCGARLVAWVGSGQLRRMGTGAGGWVVPRWTRFVSRETVVAAAGCPADMTLPSITTKHTLIFLF